MIIGACGFGSTGSSAVCDYLKEFNQNQALDDFEFFVTYLPDGLEDLDYHLNSQYCKHEASAIAIPRFRRFVNYFISHGQMTKLTPMSSEQIEKLTDDFLNSIIQVKWKTVNRTDRLLFPSLFYRYFGSALMNQKILPRLNKLAGKSVDLYPVRNVDFSVNPDNFDVLAKSYVHSILELMGADFSKNIILDQPFLGEFPQKSFKYFDDPYAIIVDRDPRDVYLFMKKFLYKKKRYVPCDNVEDFVIYYSRLRRNKPYLEENERILRIQFEALLYQYDETTKLIRDFLHLPDNNNAFSIFNPEQSKANTRLFLRWPEYSEDINYIEKELPEFLYDFSPYPVSESTEMFMGRSPLNK